MQASKDGILPPQQVFGKVSRFESPLNALFLGGFVTLLLIIGPPPGEAYDFLVLLSSYPLWVFYGLALIGLIVMRFTQPEMKRPVRTFIPGTIFFIICCVMLAFVPFIKPKGISTTGAPYWLVPTLGSSIILLFAMMRYVYSRWVCKDDGGNEKDIFEVAANAHLEIEKSNQA
jgi:amino acid transporter